MGKTSGRSPPWWGILPNLGYDLSIISYLQYIWIDYTYSLIVHPTICSHIITYSCYKVVVCHQATTQQPHHRWVPMSNFQDPLPLNSAVIVRVWPRPYSVWEDNPEDPEAIDGYFLLDVNEKQPQDLLEKHNTHTLTQQKHTNSQEWHGHHNVSFAHFWWVPVEFFFVNQLRS